MDNLIDIQIGAPIVQEFPIPPGDKNVRVAFTEECWMEWQYYVKKSPGEISVMAEVLELNTEECFTFIIKKLHMVKQHNASVYTDMDELETNKLFVELEMNGKLAECYCWIHSHFTFDCFVSGKDKANIDRWFDSGGKRLLTVITNQRGSSFAKFTWKDALGLQNHRIIPELVFESPWNAKEKDWQKNIETLCIYNSEYRGQSEFPEHFGSGLKSSYPKHFQQDDSFGDRRVAGDINRFSRSHRRRTNERGFVTEAVNELNAEIMRVRTKIAELTDALDTIQFGTQRYNDIAQEIFAAEVELSDLNKKHFTALFTGVSQ